MVLPHVIRFAIVVSLLPGPALFALETLQLPGIEALNTLGNRYAMELQRVEKVDDPYFLSYASESASSSREYIGNTLRALQRQDIAIRAELKFREITPSKAPPANGWFSEAALKYIAFRMARNCHHCRTSEERARYGRAVREFLAFFDLRGARNGFSGLPFYQFVADRFADPEFARKTEALYQKLVDTVGKFAADPHYRLDTNLLALATEACQGNQKSAFEQLGILLSRDSTVLNYFDSIRPQSPEFVAQVGRIPLLVRLIADLDRNTMNSPLDRFSYDGKMGSRNIKNYYFWSAGLAALHLEEQAYPVEDIRELAMQLPRQYKKFRVYSRFLAPLKMFFATAPTIALITGQPGHALLLGAGDAAAATVMAINNGQLRVDKKYRDFFHRDAGEVMRNSAEGAMRALDSTSTGTTRCILREFLRTLRLRPRSRA